MSTVYTPTGLVTHGSLTLPSDGDPAVAASVNAAGFQYLADNSAWLLLQGANVFNVRNYGADIFGSSDSYPAFLAAMNDAAYTGGGIVYAPSGNYKMSHGFAWDASVCLLGDGFNSCLILDHPSDSFFNISIGGSTGHPALRFENIVLGATASNSGTVFLNNGTSSPVLMRNVIINGGFLTNLDGRPIDISSGAANWTLQNCYIQCRANATAVQVGTTAATLNVFGSTLVAPATYGAALISTFGRAIISGNVLDFSAHTTGTNPIGVNVTAGSTRPVTITGNQFLSNGGGPTEYALAWNNGSHIVTTGNEYRGVSRFYPGLGLLTSGCEVQLQPYTAQITSSATITIDPGIAFTSIQGTNTSNPTITLPKIFFEGQACSLSLYNNSGSNWTGVLLDTTDGVDGGTLGGLNTGTCYIVDCVAQYTTVGGSLRWSVRNVGAAFVPH